MDYDLRKFDKVIVVGGGKASGAMAQKKLNEGSQRKLNIPE